MDDSQNFDGIDEGPCRSPLPPFDSASDESEDGVSTDRRATQPADSELEDDIEDELEGIHFGATPPRQTRRDKQRSKQQKKLSTVDASQWHVAVQNNQHAVTGFKEQMVSPSKPSTADSSPGAFQKPARLVRVDHKTYLKSIKLHKSSFHGLEPRRMQSSPNLKAREFYPEDSPGVVVAQPAKEHHDPRHVFHKEFSLLAKLGGKMNSHTDSLCRRSLSAEGSLLNSNQEPYQVAFDALLWLELKAWKAGRTIDLQDAFLEKARHSVDQALDRIIRFNFRVVLFHQLQRLTNDAYGSDSKQYLLDIKEQLEIKTEEVVKLQEQLSDTSCEKDTPSLSNAGQRSVTTASCSPLPRSVQGLAMGIIRMALDGIDKLEQLYPTLRQLTRHHPDYASPSFKSNYKVLVMWLSVTKDLYHKLNSVARLVGIKEYDDVTWLDWHGHGLGLKCLKTQQRYKSHHSAKETNSQDYGADVGSNQEKARGRHSLTELNPTSTSRYRAFVEKSIHQFGLAKLAKCVKGTLHSTLWRANQALKLPESQQHARKDSPLVYTPSVKNVLHNRKLAIKNNLVLQPPTDIEVLKEADFQPQSFGGFGVWGLFFQAMELPSFLEVYLFLCCVSFDIALECIRYRLEHKPKGEPSSLSVKQLILECKEVIYGGIFAKEYYLEMTLSVLTSDDKDRLNAIESNVVDFENDMQNMLMLYFDYLQTLLQMLQRLPQASESLKNVFEENWMFAKEICPHIRGGEAQAGYRFCVFTSGLLDSIGHFLESSLDEFISADMDELNSCVDAKRLMLNCFRNHKGVFNETRQRAAKALGFAKMLHKDIGIAAEYRLKLPLSKVLDRLEDSDHVKVEFNAFHVHGTYEVFVPVSLLWNERQILQLLSVICGFEDPIDASQNHEGYILILNMASSKSRGRKWQRKVINVIPTVDMKISLSKIQVDGLILIACNSYQLSVHRKAMRGIFGPAVEPISEQTSSHETISTALKDLKASSLSLCDVIVASVEQAQTNLNFNSDAGADEFDASVVHNSYVEAMHVCFSVGFEYLRELTRLLTEKTRVSLVPRLVKFARMWMQFTTNEVEPGRGNRPRWAAQGLDFLVMVCEPQNSVNVDEETFQILTSEMKACVKHVIGQSDSGKSTPVFRPASPAPLYRNASLSGGKMSSLCKQVSESEGASPKTALRKSSSNLSPGDRIDDFFSPEVIFAGAESDSLLSPIPSEPQPSPSDRELFEPRFKTESPLARIRQSLHQLESRRQGKLREAKAVGSVCDHQPENPAMGNVNVRKVSFKWQLGLKLGEGRFGKVFSCVNLDTGELMAMKQVRFQPNDYSAIQQIADEFKNIEGLKHESIVAYYGVELHRSEMLIFMEHCADGTIADVARLGLPESMVRAYSLQILKAISFLHRNRIVHRDIKGANIFLSSNGLVKLGDFGSAVKLNSTLHTLQGEVSHTHGTTVAYMAPEIITEDKSTGYGRTADIWSFGCVVVEMATGKSPWPDCDNMYMIMYKVGSGASPDVPADALSEEGKEFLSYCFITSPDERWSAEMLENHPFVKVRD